MIEKEFENIENQHRNERYGEEQIRQGSLIQNLKAKRGLETTELTSISAGKLNKMSEWERFKEKSKDHAQIMQSSRPEIAVKIGRTGNNWKRTGKPSATKQHIYQYSEQEKLNSRN